MLRTNLWLIPIVMITSQLPLAAAEILPGTSIQVRSDNPIEVGHWDRGRVYPAHVAADVFGREGQMVVPRGSYAELLVRQTGPGQYALDLESLTVHGQRYVLDTTGPQYNMPQANYRQGNGVLGAIAGAIAGAEGQQVVPRGAEIRVPAGSLITFNLQEPLHVATWNDPGYSQGSYHYHHDRDWYR